MGEIIFSHKKISNHAICVVFLCLKIALLCKMNWKIYIKNYQSYLRIERGLSKNTIDNYSFDIERLCLFLDENAISVSAIQISEETIQQFIYGVSKEVNPRSQGRIFSGL